jgi:hypothetical protein
LTRSLAFFSFGNNGKCCAARCIDNGSRFRDFGYREKKKKQKKTFNQDGAAAFPLSHFDIGSREAIVVSMCVGGQIKIRSYYH